MDLRPPSTKRYPGNPYKHFQHQRRVRKYQTSRNWYYINILTLSQSRIDDRFITKRYNHFWQLAVDPTKPYDFEKCGPPAGGLFNTIAHYTWDERISDTYFAGPTATFQEPSFIAKGGGEGEGYIVALLNHLDVLRNDIVILDAQNVSKGPVATIHLPLKLKLGLHGNFVDQKDIDEWRVRRGPEGDIGPVRTAEQPLLWQERLLQEQQRNGANLVNGVH